MVDTAKVLQTLAVRRNADLDANEDFGRARGNSELLHRVGELAKARFEEYCALIKVKDHPLSRLHPVPSVLMLETDAQGRRLSGGLTSIDGVHPSTIGYGIAAEGFLKRLQVDFPSMGHATIPWPEVIAADRILSQPPCLWDDVRRLLSTFKFSSDSVFRSLPFG